MILKRLLFTIGILCYLASANIAQQIITTKSGQRLLYYENGTWDWAPTQKLLDSVDMVTNSQIFEAPEEESMATTPEQQKEIETIMADIKMIEAESRVQIEVMNERLQINDLELALATEQENQEEIDRLKVTKNISKESRNIYEDMQDDSADIIKRLNKLKEKGSKRFTKDLNKIKTRANEKLLTDFELTEILATTTEPKPRRSKKAKKVVIKTDKVSYPRDVKECDIAFDDYDANLDEKRKSTSYHHLFSYTHPKTKSFFKTKDFLNADVSMERVGKLYFINLKVKMNSKDASKTYGYIGKEDRINIELLDGKKVFGQSIMVSEGEIEPYSGATIYSIIYKLEKEDFKLLAKKLVSSIGIIWSTGYEEYEIYDVDLIKNQANCVLNKQS